MLEHEQAFDIQGKIEFKQCFFRCDKKFNNVLAECVHVFNSRLQHEFKNGGSMKFLREEIRRLGCLYKEFTVPLGLNNSNREQHKVVAVMTHEQNLEWNDEDTVMIKSLATCEEFEGNGLGSSFFHDI